MNIPGLDMDAPNTTRPGKKVTGDPKLFRKGPPEKSRQEKETEPQGHELTRKKRSESNPRKLAAAAEQKNVIPGGTLQGSGRLRPGNDTGGRT